MQEKNEEKWGIVYAASGMINARIVAGRLETEGIPTKLKYEAVGAIYALTIDGLGEVKVMVPVSCVDNARKILSESYQNRELKWKD